MTSSWSSPASPQAQLWTSPESTCTTLSCSSFAWVACAAIAIAALLLEMPCLHSWCVPLVLLLWLSLCSGGRRYDLRAICKADFLRVPGNEQLRSQIRGLLASCRLDGSEKESESIARLEDVVVSLFAAATPASLPNIQRFVAEELAKKNPDGSPGKLGVSTETTTPHKLTIISRKAMEEMRVLFNVRSPCVVLL